MDTEQPPGHLDYVTFIAGCCGGVGYVLLVVLTLAPRILFAVPPP